jgi:hypothetical protein
MREGNQNASKKDKGGYVEYYTAFGQRWRSDDDRGRELLEVAKAFKSQKEFLCYVLESVSG